MKFDVGGKIGRFILSAGFYFKIDGWPNQRTVGITSKNRDGSHVLFADYDDTLYSEVLEDIKHVQNVFGVGDCIVLCNSEALDNHRHVKGNYLLCFPAKIPFHKVREILGHMRVDKRFIECCMRTPQKSWVIRIAEKMDRVTGELVKKKPRFKAVIPGRMLKRRDMDHYNFFQRFFLNRPIKEACEVNLIIYETGGDLNVRSAR
jgi:hypothetical protein